MKNIIKNIFSFKLNKKEKEDKKSLLFNNDKLKLNPAIINFFDTKTIETINDILELPNNDIIINNISIGVYFPVLNYDNQNILLEANISLKNNNNIDFCEINFNNKIDELIKYNNNFNQDIYYNYYKNIILDPTNTQRKYLKEPICLIKELYKIYKEKNINYPENYEICRNILVPVDSISLNDDFEYYFNITLNNNKNILFKVKISNNDKNILEIPNNILLSLCLIQKHIYKIIYNSRNKIINNPLEKISILDILNNNNESLNHLQYFLLKLMCYGIYLETKKSGIPKEPEKIIPQIEKNILNSFKNYRLWAGGSSNKYQLYILNNRYFIIINDKKKYLTLKNIYINKNKLYIIINKNKYLIKH